MSTPKWIEPYPAAWRLAEHWSIPLVVAEEIVRAVPQGRKVLVRGQDYGGGSIVPREITEEIGETLLPGSLTSSKFIDVQMDWNGLLVHGRKLIPSYIEVHEILTREAAITELLGKGERPPQTMSWPTFCDAVRDRADGWISKRDGKPKRGFGDRTVERLVQQQTDKTDNLCDGPSKVLRIKK